MGDGETAESAYREAIERLGRTRCAGSSPVLISYTGSGCAARVGGWMPVSNFAPATTCSRRWEWRRSLERTERELQATGE